MKLIPALLTNTRQHGVGDARNIGFARNIAEDFDGVGAGGANGGLRVRGGVEIVQCDRVTPRSEHLCGAAANSLGRTRDNSDGSSDRH
jgi:hypothetical protein